MFDFETGFVLDGKLGWLFATDRSFITYERRFRSRCTGGHDIAAGFHRRKNKRGRRFHFLRGNFGKLIGVAIAINERRELFFRYFRRDVERSTCTATPSTFASSSSIASMLTST